MDIKSCIDFTNENKLCYLATTENGEPRVRALGFWFADESGFYFQTGAMKAMYRQLQDNPQVEACFFKQDNMTGQMLRIAGKIEFVDDMKLKERVMEERPFLKKFGLTAQDPNLIVFRLPHGQAHFWTMADNLKPKQFIEF